MLNTYLKIAARNLLKRKGFFLLNVLGITIGMTSCLLIFHYVSDEKSFDGQAPETAYRIRLDYYNEGRLEWKSATSYPGIGPTMKKDYPEVNAFCRLIDAQVLLLNPATNTKFIETQGYLADTSFFDMFGVSLNEGNAKTALQANKIVISSAMAKKYFGNEQALGKTILVKHRSLETDSVGKPHEVSGVFDFPKNSHLDIEYLLPMSTLKVMIKDTSDELDRTYGWYDFYTYIQIKPGTDAKQLEAKLPVFSKKHIDTEKTANTHHELSLIPVKDIHLYSNYNQEAEANGNGRMVAVLFLIAIFIIVIAWINYINLTTARSVERAKEVGVKKVLGAIRTNLIGQFFTENILLNTIALVISIVVFALLYGSFDGFTGHSGFHTPVLSPFYILVFVTLFLVGTFLSGLYPAFVLSAFKPVKVLKGAFKSTSRGVWLRKSLTVGQFIISVLLISGTIIIYQQVQFMRSNDLGVNIDRTLVVAAASSVPPSTYFKGSYQPFKTELLQQPGIKSISASTEVAGNEIIWTNGGRRIEGTKKDNVTLYNLGIDYDFIPAYDIKLVAGRNFSPQFPSDEKAALLNENCVRALGYKTSEEAVGRKIRNSGDTLSIIGVIADYHHEGLQKAVNPMLIRLTPDVRRYYSIKINSNDTKATVAQIEKTWNSYFPADPFNYFFLDDSFNKQYKTDILFGKVFGIFSILAISIACLGLLGLSAYNVTQRSKEIGVRKILGASAQNILVILSRDFIWLILIALVVAVPLGWYVMGLWLRDFAYRIDVQWWVFLLAGSLALLIAVVTIVLNAYKAVMENPVKSLRTE